MFRFFEKLVDPYVAYPENDTPPQTLGAFLWDYATPFRGIFAVTG
ncbi:MAG: ATP-binding cassette subfamily B multidrug efflux pump, partial [Yoonia sp.]